MTRESLIDLAVREAMEWPVFDGRVWFYPEGELWRCYEGLVVERVRYAWPRLLASHPMTEDER